jgi:hypothetical protein
MRRVLVVYYTQTGQLKQIVDSVLSPFLNQEDVLVEYDELKPLRPYPFPWTSDQFFQAFPESVKGIPCDLQAFTHARRSYDLVILAYQPWYLAPSVPVRSFLMHPEARLVLNNTPVVTVIGCRNMWATAQEQVKRALHDAGARLSGNIVLRDKAANLLTVLSIARWMFTGKRDRFLGVIPPAGVAAADIVQASRFGTILLQALRTGDFGSLQERLNSSQAVEPIPHLLMLERNGSRMFRIWAAIILRMGPYNDPRRLWLLRIFKYYLLSALFLISPIAILIFYLFWPFRINSIRRTIAYYSQNSLKGT